MSYYRDARERAKRRRSAWNLILIPAVLAPLLLMLVGSWELLAELYRLRHGGEFVWLPSGWRGTVMALAPFFAWVPPSMVVGNFLVSLIPRAREALDAEAVGHVGTSFVESNRGLVILTWRIAPLALLASLFAAVY